MQQFNQALWTSELSLGRRVVLPPAPAAPLVQLCPAAQARLGLVNYSTARGMSASVGLSVCENTKVSTFFHSLSLDVFSVPGVEQVLGTLSVSPSLPLSLSPLLSSPAFYPKPGLQP